MSSRHRGLRALALGGLAALMVAAFGAASAWAEPSTYCVKATKVTKIISGKTKHVFTGAFNDKGCTSVNATNEGKFDKLASFTAPEEAELKALLKYVKRRSQDTLTHQALQARPPSPAMRERVLTPGSQSGGEAGEGAAA